MRQPTFKLTIIAKVTVRTRTIDLNILLGGGTDGVGKGIGVDVDGSELLSDFLIAPLLFDWVVVGTTSSMQSESDMIFFEVVKQ